MRPLLSALLLLSSAAIASPVLPRTLTPVFAAQTPPTTPATKEDEEEDEEEAEDAQTPSTSEMAPGTAAPPPPPPTPPNGAAADAPYVSARPLDPKEKERQQQLVSGAPLYNPNVAVHIVERKQFSDAGKSELALYPVAAQFNGKFVQHHGTALSYTYHVNENFGLQLTPQYNWYNKEARFNEELVNSFNQVPEAASALLLQWAGIAGVEISPFYGKFAFYGNSLAHFSVVINGGAGLGQTRAQIRGRSESNGVVTPPSYGDAGLRFIGSIGAGFRVQIGDRFALRLEARDLVYSAQVNSVNGCNESDLLILDEFTDQNDRPLAEANVRGSCDTARFEGRESTGYDRQRDLVPALDLVRRPSSDVLNNVGFYSGFSFLF